jgi:hypothetical protein
MQKERGRKGDENGSEDDSDKITSLMEKEK